MSASPVSSTPFFGRAYSLKITKADGSGTITVSDSAWEPEALRFTFEIQQWALQTYWFAVITIYNCDGQIQNGPSKGQNLFQTVINEGDIVTVVAGYQDNGPDTVWVGEIFQPIATRENVVDSKLTLHCLIGRLLGPQNFINTNIAALSTQRQQASVIASQSLTPVPYDPSQLEAFTPKQLPRGKSYFGNPANSLYALAKDNQFVSWMDCSWKDKNGNPTAMFNFANPGAPGPVAASYAPVYSPGSIPQTAPNGVTLSLVGTPQQTLFGVDFQVLMDPRMKVKVPFSQVQIDLAAVQQIPTHLSSEGQGQLVRPLAKNGKYIVIGVRHVGDTRGRDWHTYVTGIDSISDVQAVLGNY